MKAMTPVETYHIQGRRIYVKRDDVFGSHPLPPLGKIRGLDGIIKNLYRKGIRTIGYWDTAISQIGQAIAVTAMKYPGLEVILSYPANESSSLPESLKIAVAYNAKLYPIPELSIQQSLDTIHTYVKKKNGVVLSLGLDCIESIESISLESTTIRQEWIDSGTLITSCGSGMTFAGIIKGLSFQPKMAIGMSVAKTKNEIVTKLKQHLNLLPDGLTIVESRIPYSCPIDFECPFPCNPYYDLKAWKYLNENISCFPDPVLFWNIGA